jgi:hypothetical protein
LGRYLSGDIQSKKGNPRRTQRKDCPDKNQPDNLPG